MIYCADKLRSRRRGGEVRRRHSYSCAGTWWWHIWKYLRYLVFVHITLPNRTFYEKQISKIFFFWWWYHCQNFSVNNFVVSFSDNTVWCFFKHKDSCFLIYTEVEFFSSRPRLCDDVHRISRNHFGLKPADCGHRHQSWWINEAALANEWSSDCNILFLCRGRSCAGRHINPTVVPPASWWCVPAPLHDGPWPGRHTRH